MNVRSDNLMDVSDVALGRAAVEFFRTIEAGTAVIGIPGPGGSAIFVGDSLIYKSLSGWRFQAKIISLNSDDTVNLDVSVVGCRNPVRLSGIKIAKVQS